MQNSRIFKVLDIVFKTALCSAFVLSLIQNYVSRNGAIDVFGFHLKQFYEHSDLRIAPLLIITFFLVSQLKKALRIEGHFYFSYFLISLLCFIDAFTHINGYYSVSFNLFFYERIWFDKVMHFNEGLILLPAFLPLAFRFTLKSSRIFFQPKAWAYFISIGFVSIFFICWEIIELFIDKIYHTKLITSYYDTNEDLAFAYAGLLTSFLFIEIYSFAKHNFFIKE